MGDTRKNQRCMGNRQLADILNAIATFRELNNGLFPTTRCRFPDQTDSWNAIDGALRRGAIVPCPAFLALKSSLLERGLQPSLARLAPDYRPRRVGLRRFSDILALIDRHTAQHCGHFPLRTDCFDLEGDTDTWVAIDSALIAGAIIPCAMWQTHLERLKKIGVAPSLATLNPTYRARHRRPRIIQAIRAAIISYMCDHDGSLPNQRARFNHGDRHDTWKAICKALRAGAIQDDSDKHAFEAYLSMTGQAASLHTLIDSCREELLNAYTLARDAGRTHVAVASPVEFAALVRPLFWTPPTALQAQNATTSHVHLKRSLMRRRA